MHSIPPGSRKLGPELDPGMRPGPPLGSRAGTVLQALVALLLTTSTLAAQEPDTEQDPDTAQDTPALIQESTGLRQDPAALGQDIEPVTGERARQDEAIRNQLQAVFDRVPDLAGVEVGIDAGVVHLEGTVLRSETRTRAGELASRMDGVLFVDNRIRESTSLEQQLQPTWTRLRELGYGIIAKTPLILVALLIVGIAVVLGSLVARWGGPKALQPRNPFLQSLVGRVLRFVLIVAGLFVAFDLLNATALVGALVGTAGLAGIAIGFAFRDIVENYLAGVILALRQPFEKNDHIRVETFEGKVVRLTARETIMMTLDGNHVRIPNALILRNPMLNFTRNPLRRFDFEAGVGTSDDLALAREVAVGALTGVEGVLAHPAPQALVTRLGDSTVTMQFVAWIDQRQTDFLRVRSEAIRSVKTRLEAEGLNLPSPEFLIRLDEGMGTLTPGQDITILAPEEAPAAQEPVPAPTTRIATKPADVSVDHAVDRQIEEDRRVSDEPDLLEKSEPKTKRR